MITSLYIRKIGWAILITIFLFPGCQSSTPLVDFYTLTSMTATPEDKPDTKTGKNISVGVGPLMIPKIIDRPQIVTRSSPNKLNVAEFHRWGGSLHEDFLRTLTENLSILLNSNRVAAYPWEDHFDPGFRIFLEVHQFDGRLDEYVILNVTWTVTGREAEDVLLVRRSIIRETVSGIGYEAFVSTKSRVLANLSREIAHEFKILIKT